ncbi:hypothetical protein D3C80_1405510 [compost metagenome]
MPTRAMAINDARPDRISSATRPQPGSDNGCSGATPSPCGLNSALIRLSLPINPESGGMPTINRAQAMKLRPRKAIVQGMTWPTTAFCSSSRLMPLGGCRDSMAGGSRSGSSSSDSSLTERERSINSASRNRAHRARVELTR